MIIRRLRLVNFISHRDTVIEIPRGLTAIVGSNGAGKTAILDAISYALFKEHSRGREGNLINRRAASARVQLEFEANGRPYEVAWRIERGKRPLAALRDLETGSPILVDAGERTAIPEIERILGVSREVFLNAAYIRQGEIARLLEARPAERKELIAKLLGIDVLERIWESLRAPIRILEERLSKLREEAGKLGELEGRLRELEAELEKAEKLLSSKTRRLKELEADLERVEGELKKLENERRRVEGLREAVAKLEKLIDGKRRELEAARREYEIVREAEDKAEMLEEARSEKLKLESEAKRLESEISEMRVELGRLELLEKRLREMLEELEHIDRRSAVKQILGSRIRRQFSDLDSENILDSITNPDVLTEPAILLNLHLVFFASSSGSDIYEQKARAYANRTEEAIAALEGEFLEETAPREPDLRLLRRCGRSALLHRSQDPGTGSRGAGDVRHRPGRESPSRGHRG